MPELKILGGRPWAINCGLLVTLVMVCAPTLSAEDAATTSTPVEEVEPIWLDQTRIVAEFVADLSAGRKEEAWQLYRTMLTEQPKRPETPFEPDPFEHFASRIGRLAPIDELTLISQQKLTRLSRRLVFIGDSIAGPIVIEFLVYQHRDKFYFGAFSYTTLSMADPNERNRIDGLLSPSQKLRNPLVIPLPKREAVTEVTKQ